MPTRNPRRGAVCFAARVGFEPTTNGLTVRCTASVLPCQIPVRFSVKTTTQSEVLPDGVFRSLLERLPLSPDGRFVVVLLVALGFSEEIFK